MLDSRPMSKHAIFIDGSAGTTGLRIRERLAGRSDVEIVSLPEETRKDPAARAAALAAADVAVLCLPDAAAREAVALAGDAPVRIVDTSTAHRTAEGWAYGMPELPGQRERIRASRRVANPGCHASGFIALVAPLVRAGLLRPDAELAAFSLTGYTGGGKKMIADYEGAARGAGRDPLLDAPRQYGLAQAHKHLPEMVKVCGLEKAPAFCPVVADYACGMEVTVPLFASQLRGTRADVAAAYREAYPDGSGLIRFAEAPDAAEGGFLSAGAFSGRDDMQVAVLGSDDRILLVSRFDNLGKGASGAAIQNLNLLLGAPEAEGLVAG